MFEKYQKYQLMQHSWTGINCLTIIEEIYKENLNLDFSATWNRLKRKDGKVGINSNWHQIYDITIFMKEIENWAKVPLTNLKEYDILIFVNRKKIPMHFGMYIGQNYFIHIEENKKGEIKLLDDYWRNKLENLGGAYRLPSVV